MRFRDALQINNAYFTAHTFLHIPPSLPQVYVLIVPVSQMFPLRVPLLFYAFKILKEFFIFKQSQQKDASKLFASFLNIRVNYVNLFQRG